MQTLLALAMGLAGLAGGSDDGIQLGDMPAPPWTASAHEQPSDPAGLGPCEHLLKTFAARTHDRIISKTYTTSPRWEKIVRVRIISVRDGASAPALITCWGGPKGVQFAFKIDDGEP